MDHFERQIQEWLTQEDSDGPAFDGDGECSDIDRDIESNHVIYESHHSESEEEVTSSSDENNQPLSNFQSSRKRSCKRPIMYVFVYTDFVPICIECSQKMCRDCRETRL